MMHQTPSKWAGTMGQVEGYGCPKGSLVMYHVLAFRPTGRDEGLAICPNCGAGVGLNRKGA